MKIIITVKGTDNIIGLKEDIAMRLEGIADILRIDTIDVTPNSDVAREIFEEIDDAIENLRGAFLRQRISELKKKYIGKDND